MAHRRPATGGVARTCINRGVGWVPKRLSAMAFEQAMAPDPAEAPKHAGSHHAGMEAQLARAGKQAEGCKAGSGGASPGPRLH